MFLSTTQFALFTKEIVVWLFKFFRLMFLKTLFCELS